ncbi:DEAD/DEAH box helicase [Roseospira goensis]|uniref:ATP-dependent RNA helicase RhlE n=1 Tax=Roseospira goensis TaxID=391922 RepID=A0A7W6WJJ3_9PROT|nr:DEAD/DEAH box helicase [Roseospira goensis]MBB4284593.1 ATP-dependent RNA helicase RhlE [Roseospira goensis]
MTQFSDLGLAEPVLRAIATQGYTHPTPIQARVIPTVLDGRDVVGIAQTGTGKTAAFVLPLLHRLATEPRRAPARGCRALILVPTRELAAQVADSIRDHGRFVRHTTALVIGGARPGPQVRALAPGVDILVATPGRLLDHLGAGAVRLDAAETVVLDEADQMLDLGFLPAIRRLMAAVPKQRRTLLLSATMPKAIRTLANDFLTDPVEVAVAPAARPIETIDQSVRHVDGPAKRGVLIDLLGCPTVERAIVFTRTKRGADRVNRHLQEAGLSAAAIHGNKSQSQRERALTAFRAGGVTVLVATDIAARGIDVDGVSHVINYELPNVPEAYVHRIGRTARAGRSGVAISLCDPAERSLLRDIERLIGRTLDPDGAANAGVETRTETMAETTAEASRRGRAAGPASRAAAPRDPAERRPPRRRSRSRSRARPAAAAAAGA